MSSAIARRAALLSIVAGALVAVGLVPRLARAQGHYADINGAHIYYEDEGVGHPLILIHGWPMSTRMWDEQVRVLKNHYRVVRYDRRGFGRSPGQPWNESSAEHDPADLEALMRYLKIPSAYILGHSQGGSVATQFTLDHPDQVDALILHGAGLDGFVLPEKGPFASLESVRALIRTQGMAAFRQQWLAFPINHVPDGKPEVTARITEIVNYYTADDILQSTPAPRQDRVPAIQRLSEIKAPTLVLVGGDDQPFFKITAEALAFLIPHAQEAVVRGGGHLVNMVEPELYNAEVLRFLRAVDRSRDAH
jgi:pimeloyl-ACP methyl ester carboxylesterase